MNPSPQAVAAIRSKVSDWTPTDGAIAASLNTPTVANPTPQPVVPIPLTVAGAMALVSAENRAKVYARPAVVAFRDDVNRGDLAGALGWLTLARDAGDLADSEYAAIAAAAQASGPDPAWQPRISWAMANLGRPVDPSDIAASRPGA